MPHGPLEGRAGYFTVTRDWDTLPGGGPGFIVQQITRQFSALEIYTDGAWIPATPRKLRKFMGAGAYQQLYYQVTSYWEIFPVPTNGVPLNDDTFSLGVIAKPGNVAAGDFWDTSRGRFTQTGVARFVRTTMPLNQFTMLFNLATNGCPLANGLYSRTTGDLIDEPRNAADPCHPRSAVP